MYLPKIVPHDYLQFAWKELVLISPNFILFEKQTYRSRSGTENFGNQHSADKVPENKVKQQKEKIGFMAYLTRRARSPCQVELQWESPRERVRDGGDDIRSPNQAGYDKEKETQDDLEQTGLDDRFHGHSR